MKYVILILFVLLIGSCDSSPERGKDGYVFGQPQYERENVKVNIVTYSEEEFKRELIKHKLPSTTAAFTELKQPYDTCTIHMVYPGINYEPEFIGHEFLHCVYGQWHTNNESTS